MEKGLHWDELQLVHDVDDGFRDRTPSRRPKFQNLCNDSRTNYNWTGSSNSYHTIISGFEIQIPSTPTKERTSWVVISRGKNRYVEELHLNDPDNNPTSFELLLERSVAKERESCSTKMQQPSSIEETHAKQLKIQTNPVYNYSEEGIPVGERKWNDISACQQFRGILSKPKSQEDDQRWIRRSGSGSTRDYKVRACQFHATNSAESRARNTAVWRAKGAH